MENPVREPREYVKTLFDYGFSSVLALVTLVWYNI